MHHPDRPQDLAGKILGAKSSGELLQVFAAWELGWLEHCWHGAEHNGEAQVPCRADPRVQRMLALLACALDEGGMTSSRTRTVGSAQTLSLAAETRWVSEA